MKVDEKIVDHIANLARLEFDQETKKDMVKDMNNIVAFVEKLNEVDTDNVEPLIYLTQEEASLREDVLRTEITQDQALSNAPKKDSDYFKVPRVMSKQK